ncbi:MAG: 3'(2'),5'-bisphosphate nucleotidase CysQ [Candidatus Puniceispirillaceae bacterium]
MQRRGAFGLRAIHSKVRLRQNGGKEFAAMVGQEQSQIDYSVLVEALIAPVQHAGRVIMEIYQSDLSAETKADGSPVTKADRAAEAILLAEIATLAPSIQIISEENAASHSLSASKEFFLVDPLDGTKEFIKACGDGAFTVNIGLIKNAEPVMGIVFAPALDRLFFGSLGNGAFEISGGICRQICVRMPPAEGPVAVASASHRDAQTNQWLEKRGVTNSIAIGSSLKFCLIAAGEADLYPRYGPTMEWDTAAGDAVLRAAGGRVMAEDGKPFPYGKAGYRNEPFFAAGGG